MKRDLKELISYIIVGGCTTLVNFVIYAILLKMSDHGWLMANVVSWLGAVMFAFFANRHFVFKSINEAGQEAYQFFVLRLVTLVVENILLFIAIQLLGSDEMIAKIVVSVVTVIANYGFCKFKIFVGGQNYGQN